MKDMIRTSLLAAVAATLAVAPGAFAEDAGLPPPPPPEEDGMEMPEPGVAEANPASEEEAPMRHRRRHPPEGGFRRGPRGEGGTNGFHRAGPPPEGFRRGPRGEGGTNGFHRAGPPPEGFRRGPRGEGGTNGFHRAGPPPEGFRRGPRGEGDGDRPPRHPEGGFRRGPRGKGDGDRPARPPKGRRDKRDSEEAPEVTPPPEE